MRTATARRTAKVRIFATMGPRANEGSRTNPERIPRVALSNIAGSAASGFVASIPIFEVKPSRADGSIEEPRTSCRTTSPRSAWNRVAIAHSTSRSSKTSMSSSTMTTCFIEVCAPKAARIDERALVVDLVDEAALEDVLGLRGHREAALDPNHVSRLAEAGLRERGRDPTFIDAVLDGCPAGEEVPRIESDADGDLELAPGLHRLVVHVTQMTGDDAARPSIGAQDQDAVERQVTHAFPFGDPYAGGHVATRVLREQLRDRELP